MNISDADVIIIRGAPGSGKSKAAKALARHFPKGARIEVDSLRRMVISVDWTNQAEHINMLSICTSLVTKFLALGYRPVILVDTFSGNKLKRWLRQLHSLDSTLKVQSFALIAAPEVLRSRVENREADGFKDVAVCQKLNSDVVKCLLPFEQLIDTTELTPEQTVSAILSRGLPTGSSAIRDPQRQNATAAGQLVA